MQLRKEWLEAVSRWEALRTESKLMQQANASYEELTHEIRQTKVLVKARKQAFFAAVERLNTQTFDFAR